MKEIAPVMLKKIVASKARYGLGQYKEVSFLRCRAARRPDSWSAQKVKNFEIIVGPGPGTLKKPKYHYIVVGGLLVQELEPLKDLKAEKGWFFGQN